MNEIKTKPKLSLVSSKEELEERLLTEEDPDNLQNIVDLFNLNIRKKDIIRASKLNELQDRTVEQMANRLENKADEFSNKDLLDYFKIIQDTITKSGTSPEVPQIQINQQQIKIEDNTLSRESRARVADAIQAILNGTGDKEQPIDVDYMKEED